MMLERFAVVFFGWLAGASTVMVVLMIEHSDSYGAVLFWTMALLCIIADWILTSVIIEDSSGPTEGDAD